MTAWQRFIAFREPVGKVALFRRWMTAAKGDVKDGGEVHAAKVRYAVAEPDKVRLQHHKPKVLPMVRRG